jgi:hypothetical protein
MDNTARRWAGYDLPPNPQLPVNKTEEFDKK